MLSLSPLSSEAFKCSEVVPVSFHCLLGQTQNTDFQIVAGPVLKPDVFQDFTLTEKTVLSHNTAM